MRQGDMMNEEAFYSLWRPLYRFAVGRGVDNDEAEDLVMETICTVIDRYSPERGDILAFSFTVLRNRITNFHTRGPLKSPLTIDIEDEAPTPLDHAIRREDEHRAQSLFRRLVEMLTPKEIRFLEILRTQVADDGQYNVSEAARQIGIEPLRGHDLFKKIQRKLHQLPGAGMLVREPEAEVSADRKSEDRSRVMYSMSFDPIDEVIQMLKDTEGFGRYLRIAEVVKKLRP